MANEGVDPRRRRVLTVAASVVGGAGVAAAIWPFLASFQPSARAQAAGAPVEADISKVEEGQLVIHGWRGRPVWVVRRSQAMLGKLPELNERLRDPNSEVVAQQPEYARNINRSIRPEILVLIGSCTHLGCSPSYRPEVGAADLGGDWPGGFFCPCHGSKFDLAGRVYKGVPAPTNLIVPPYRFRTETTIVIGEDGGKA